MMLIEWTLFAGALGAALGATAFILVGLRFRRWSVEGRIGVPRFPTHVETVLIWLVYSSWVAIVIVLTLQVLRHL